MKIFWHRLIALFALGLLVFTVLSACRDLAQPINKLNLKSSTTGCRVVQHVRGETCIPLNPRRIVTLDFNSLAAVLALDIKPIATWITTEIEAEFPYFQGKTDGIEILRSLTGQPNLEKLISLHPDLIIVISHPAFEHIYQYLPRIAPTIVLPWSETIGNWQIHLKEAARVLGKPNVADKLMEDYSHRIEMLKGLFSDRFPSIRMSFAYVASGQLVITRQKSFAGNVLDDLGILNPLFADSGDVDLPISEELLPEIDSNVIFIAPLRKDDYSAIKQLQQKPFWTKLKAAQNHQVYIVDFSVWRGLNIFAAHKILDDLEKYLAEEKGGERQKAKVGG